MQKQIMVVGALTSKGKKIIHYLKNNDCFVIGVERHDKESSEADRFFRLDFRHRESSKLLTTFTNPEILIYCWERGSFNSYLGFFNLWDISIPPLSRIGLVIDDNLPKPKTIDEVLQNSMACLLSVIACEKKVEDYLITNQDNLLRTIKKIIS